MRRLLVALVVVVGATVALLALGSATGVVHTWAIPASSMEPTLRCGDPAPGCSAGSSDRVLTLDYVLGEPERGDLVAFRAPPLARHRCGAGGVYVKRVVALPGERFGERRGRVTIGGKLLREPYLEPGRRDARTIAAKRVPAAHYIVLGDNRTASCDSREWGPVARGSIIGQVVLRYWPPDRIGRP